MKIMILLKNRKGLLREIQNFGSLSNIPDSIESLHNQKYLPSNQ